MFDILGVIEAMSNEGYPDSAIVATVRAKLEAERRGEDEYWCEQEADRYARAVESRSRLAALVGTTADPFRGTTEAAA